MVILNLIQHGVCILSINFDFMNGLDDFEWWFLSLVGGYYGYHRWVDEWVDMKDGIWVSFIIGLY